VADLPEDRRIGPRTRYLRRQRQMTLDSLAAATGLTKSFLSKVERGASVPSIATALRLAHAFEVSVGQLLGEAEDSKAVSVLRRADRHSFMQGDAVGDGDDYVPLVPGRAVKAMEPFLVRPPAQFRPARLPSTHMGEEFIYVLGGSVEIDFGDRLVMLEYGDSLYFDASLPHRTRSLGGQPAEILVVVQP
jgi:transcriptional regulator with XRE-family HTH domain